MRFMRLCAAAAAVVLCMHGIYAQDTVFAAQGTAKETTPAASEKTDGFLLDDCVNFDSALGHSDDLFAYTVPEEDYYAFDDDYTMFRRTTNTPQWIEYKTEDKMYPVFYTYFKYTKNIPHFSFLSSADGDSWQEVKPVIKVMEREDWKWIPVEYSLKGIDDSQKYIKIIFSDKSEAEWSPMLAGVYLKYKQIGGNGFADCAGTPYDSAVTKLKCLGLVQGYDEYRFKPYDNVSRAEFAKMNCDILALSLSGGGERVFNDVLPNDWEAPSVAALYRQGIINGDGDGSFNPDADVTYIQAAKMLVCSLGYFGAAEEAGGYPDGFRIYANRLRLFDGLSISDENAAMNRGECARMISNAIEAELIYQSSFGDNPEYIKNGETVLHKYLGIDTAEGTVTGASGMTIISDIKSGKDIVTIGNATYKVPKFNAEELLGRNVKFYIKDDTLLYAEPRGGDVKRITADKFIKLDGVNLVYETDDGREREVSLNANTRIVYNGRYKSRAGVSGKITLESGYMDLIGSGGSTDTILIWNYIDRIAANSAKISDRITDRLGESFELDASNAEYCRVIAYGEETKYSEVSVSKNDIISAAVSEDGKVMRISVRNDSISGKISYVSDTGLFIGKDEYKTADNLKKLGGDISAGADVCLYTDMNGRVFAAERMGVSEYAYLQSAGASGAFGDSPSLRCITTGGETAVYYADSRTRLNGAADKASKIALLEPQLIRISRRADGTLASVETAEYNEGLIGTDAFTLAYKSDSCKYYGGALCVFASRYQLSGQTPVFIIPKDTNDTDKYEVTNRQGLITDFDYKTELFDISNGYIAGAAVIYADGSRERGIEGYDQTAVISKSEVINNADGEPCLKLTVYTKGAEGYVYFDNDGGEDRTGGWLPNYVKRDTSNGNNPFKAGEVIQYYSDSKSHCRSFRMVMTEDMAKSGTLYEKNTGDYSAISSENYFSELYTAHAVVKERFDDKLMTSADDTGSVLRTVPLSGASVYIYDKKRGKLITGSTSDISKGDTVFIKMSYGDTNEIIVEK